MAEKIKYTCGDCGNQISRPDAKRCLKCENISHKGKPKNFSKKELEKRRKQMSINRKSGLVRTWNKGISMKELYPERINNMIKKLKGRRLNRKGEFKKGHHKSLHIRGNLICKHHIDLNQNNNNIENFIYLLNSAHNSLHKRAYNYLVQQGLIRKYIKWFIKNFKPKIYDIKDYYKQMRGNNYGK